MKKLLILAALVLSPAVHAQSVKQSGNVTPGHATRWCGNGIICDAGTAQNGGITSLGIQNNGGPGICLNSGPITGAYNQLCWSVGQTTAATLSLNNYNGASAQALRFNINGSTYDFPYTVGGIVGPGSTTIGHAAVWANTTGSLLADNGWLTFAPPSGFNRVIDITQTASGTTTTDTVPYYFGDWKIGWNYNLIKATDSGVAISDQTPPTVHGFQVVYSSNGSKSIASAIQAEMDVFAVPDTSSSTNNQYVGIGANATGGVSGQDMKLASLFGGGFTANATQGTNWDNITGAEINAQLQTGTTASRYSVLSLAPGPGHAEDADDYNAILSIGNTSSHGVPYGILFSTLYNGSTPPVATTGTVIGASTAVGDASTVDTVIDFSNYTATSYFLKFHGGNTWAGNGNLITTGFISAAPTSGNANIFAKAGSSAQSNILLQDHDSTIPWTLQKDASDNFKLIDSIANKNFIQAVHGGALTLDSGSNVVSNVPVAITGTLSATGGMNSTTVGAVSPATGKFTTLTATTALYVSSSAPSASTCGTSPAITGASTNQGGQFTTGTGTPTGCTITFANAYPAHSFCTISPANAAAVGVSGGTYISASSASGFTITLGAGTNSAAYNYSCNGN